jgi:ABC-type transport system substrate-binding protein
MFNFFVILCTNFFPFINIYSKEDAQVIFRDAATYNMTGTGHVWIVTEQALFANNTPVGTLGLKLKNDNETEHITVSTRQVKNKKNKRLFKY